MVPTKPATAAGYNNEHTQACERVLVTLLEGHLRNGPVAYAQFKYGVDRELESERILEQRNASAIVTRFLHLVRHGGPLKE